ncbi:MAG: hypothetical protein FJ148_24645 [Deltaproteobacteria bacterium]|nr:hypothetical protein [Deltaproteobacteria bacterium]
MDGGATDHGSSGAAPAVDLSVARVFFSGAAAVSALLTALYLTAPPAEPHRVFAAMFAAAAILSAFVAAVMPRVPAPLVEHLLLAAILVGEAGAIAFVPLTGDPKQSVVIAIIVVAAGAVAPTFQTAVAAATLAVLGWLLVALDVPRGEFTHWIVNVTAAGVVSVAVAAGRLQALGDLWLTRFMTDRATDAIVLVGADARFLYANDAASELLEIPRDELLRLRLQNVGPTSPPSAGPRRWPRSAVPGRWSSRRSNARAAAARCRWRSRSTSRPSAGASTSA